MSTTSNIAKKDAESAEKRLNMSLDDILKKSNTSKVSLRRRTSLTNNSAGGRVTNKLRRTSLGEKRITGLGRSSILKKRPQTSTSRVAAAIRNRTRQRLSHATDATTTRSDRVQQRINQPLHSRIRNPRLLDSSSSDSWKRTAPSTNSSAKDFKIKFVNTGFRKNTNPRPVNRSVETSRENRKIQVNRNRREDREQRLATSRDVEFSSSQPQKFSSLSDRFSRQDQLDNGADDQDSFSSGNGRRFGGRNRNFDNNQSRNGNFGGRSNGPSKSFRGRGNNFNRSNGSFNSSSPRGGRRFNNNNNNRNGNESRENPLLRVTKSW